MFGLENKNAKHRISHRSYNHDILHDLDEHLIGNFISVILKQNGNICCNGAIA